jgi:predicted helicase
MRITAARQRGRERGNPRYILDLLLSVTVVSVKTVDIVAGLPGLE